MKILVIGAGSIGGYFGGRMLEAGEDVTFLVRERRQAQLAKTGLSIQSPKGNFQDSNPPTVKSDGLKAKFDLIILTCKAYDLEAAMNDFAPAVGPSTVVLPLLNGIGHLEVLDARFGAEHVIGGLCFISTTLDANGSIIHMGDMQSLTIGARDRTTNARIGEVADLLAAAQVDVHRSEDIVQDMWNKWVFIATAASLTSLMRASVGDIVEAGGAEFATGLLKEVCSIAAANGKKPDDASVERFGKMFTQAGSSVTASLMRDMEEGKMIEDEAIVGDLIRRRGDLATPLLDVAYLNMKAYLARRNRTGQA